MDSICHPQHDLSPRRHRHLAPPNTLLITHMPFSQGLGQFHKRACRRHYLPPCSQNTALWQLPPYLSPRSKFTTETPLKFLSSLVEGNYALRECTYLSHTRPTLYPDSSYGARLGSVGSFLKSRVQDCWEAVSTVLR